MRDALKCRLREIEEASSQARVERTVAHSELEKLRFRARKVEAELSIARADVSLQTTLREESREQLEAIAAELKKMQSRLDMSEDELATMCDARLA